MLWRGSGPRSRRSPGWGASDRSALRARTETEPTPHPSGAQRRSVAARRLRIAVEIERARFGLALHRRARQPLDRLAVALRDARAARVQAAEPVLRLGGALHRRLLVERCGLRGIARPAPALVEEAPAPVHG